MIFARIRRCVILKQQLAGFGTHPTNDRHFIIIASTDCPFASLVSSPSSLFRHKIIISSYAVAPVRFTLINIHIRRSVVLLSPRT